MGATSSPFERSVVIVGTGPAALMAADVLSDPRFAASATGDEKAPQSMRLRVTLVEKRRSPGRKILIAGSSGLNITHEMPVAEFARMYTGSMSPEFWQRLLPRFGAREWLQFVENELGRETFLGTSRRYFTREMKGSKLLRAWLERLAARGVSLLPGEECLDFSENAVTLSSGRELEADAIVFALGGASYEPQEEPLRWISFFEKKGIQIQAFRASNVGYRVEPAAWNPAFLAEAEGKPLKNLVLHTARGEKRGELVVTRYGLEGTPIYTVGVEGEAWLDLKPEQSFEELLQRCQRVKENLSPLRRIKKQLGLSEAALALLFHHPSKTRVLSLEDWIRLLKQFPIRLVGPQPLSEAISSSGGLSFDEVHEESLSLKRHPHVFCAGEMLDWDAPTGGFLIQGAVSTGWLAGQGVLRLLSGARV
jgi:uncharacterized flavoprotein (TIGR03862 family)